MLKYDLFVGVDENGLILGQMGEGFEPFSTTQTNSVDVPAPLPNSLTGGNVDLAFLPATGMTSSEFATAWSMSSAAMPPSLGNIEVSFVDEGVSVRIAIGDRTFEVLFRSVESIEGLPDGSLGENANVENLFADPHLLGLRETSSNAHAGLPGTLIEEEPEPVVEPDTGGVGEDFRVAATPEPAGNLLARRLRILGRDGDRVLGNLSRMADFGGAL
ncbi:MAG: hypothetical protein AAF799_01550 [Myxococcota bacterium]